jgi:tRNA pseudouridine55 synthase
VLGVLLIDKPPGISSHDVVNDVRRRFGTRRVGHAGTLDPLATGLLVVAVGPATRFLQYLPLEPKVYEGVFCFGNSTDTYDAEGAPQNPRPLPPDLQDAIVNALPSFLGLIRQVPPMYSAVKVGGKPLYRYARAGVEIEPPNPRTVHIKEFALRRIDGEEAEFRIVCSGGTYVRSLAHDLGAAIGCGAYLTRLRRTDVGRFSIGQATVLSSVSPADLLPLREALTPMTALQMDVVQTQNVREGRSIAIEKPPAGLFAALLDPAGDVFSVARIEGNFLRPECVIPAKAENGIAST